MKVIITGGGGFIGQCLAKEILSRDSLRSEQTQKTVTKVILADIANPTGWLFDELLDNKVVVRVGDVSDKSFCESLIGTPTDASDSLTIFHLGAVMSGTGEANFDLAMNVNLHGTMNMLEGARQWQSAHPISTRPTFMFTSAGATMGSGHPADWITKDDVISDATRPTPHTTYGCTKACCELLLSDYSRRSFIDGRGVRLPSVVVRAGAPNAATTSCFSAVVREPLKGVDAVLPIGSHVMHAVTGYRAAVEGILSVHEASPDTVDNLLGYDRTVFLPTRVLSLSQLADAMHRVVTPESMEHLGKVDYQENKHLSDIVGTFPTKVDSSRALALGAPPTPDAETMVREYCEDFPSDIARGVHLQVIPSVTNEQEKSSMVNVNVNVNGTETAAVAVALITGGGSGIGRAVALRLSQGGWGSSSGKGTDKEGNPCSVGIVLAGRRQTALEETQAMCIAAAQEAGCKLEVLVVPTDVTKDQEVESLFHSLKARFGRIDLLFNNAGINIASTSVEDISATDWRRVMDTNVTACWLVAKGAMNLMAKQVPQGGRIINNGSISAESPRPGAAPYTASKHAILGLTKSISLDGRKSNVACGQIDFGNVTSDLTVKMATGMPQANGSFLPEPTFSVTDAADTFHAMAALPLSANVLSMTVMATQMPFVGRG